MKHRAFNLTEALNGAPVITRDGHKVVDVELRKGSFEPYVLQATVLGEEFQEGMIRRFYTRYGQFLSGCETDKDLFMLKQETR